MQGVVFIEMKLFMHPIINDHAPVLAILHLDFESLKI